MLCLAAMWFPAVTVLQFDPVKRKLDRVEIELKTMIIFSVH